MIIHFIIMILSSGLILFVPGFFVSLIFFKSSELDVIERMSLSFALSISIMPIIYFYMNILGINISLFSITLQVIFIIITSIFIIILQKLRKNK